MSRTTILILLLLTCIAVPVISGAPRTTNDSVRTPVGAWRSTYDSVRASIAARPAHKQFEVMEHFADSLLRHDPYKAIPFTREAARLAHARGDKNEEGYLLNSLSKIYLSLGDFGTSGEYARQALVLNLEVKHDYEVARTYGITAVTYNYMGLYTNAMEYSLKALKIYERLGKRGSAASMMNSIGTIYLRLSHFEKARQYFDSALTMVPSKDTTKFKMLVLNNLACLLYRQGRADSALRMLGPLLGLARSRRDKGTEAYTLFNMGEAYVSKKKYGRAVALLRLAREASTAIHEEHGEAEASLAIARAHVSSGGYRSAIASLDEAIPYCEHARAYDLLREALSLQLTVYEKLGDVRRAFASLKAYTALTDSVFTTAEKFGVANAVFSSDLAQKEDEIARLRQEAVLNEMSIANKQQQIYVLAAFILVVIAAVIALVFLYAKSNRLRRIEIEQKTKIEMLYTQLSTLVADRKQSDELIRASQQKFQAVWDKAVDGMRLTDKDGTVLMVNQAYCRMAGMEREELSGKPLSVIYNPELHDQTVRIYRERFASRTIEPYFERELRLKDGRNMWFEVTNSYIEMENQESILLGIFRDVSLRKTLEQQLVQSQKLEGIGTLAGGIAHDFNNLLAMILGSAEMLQSKIAPDPDLQKYVDRIVEASSRGTSISRQLLVFSRPDQVQLKPISLSHTIADLQEMLKHFLPKSIAIRTVIETEDDIIMGDAGQIQQAMLNLAMNAGDAMHNRGTITIREFIADPSMLNLSISHADAPACIGLSVTDTGVGMSDSVKRKMFDPFFTTKEREKGTGLGLSSVHGIVKNHEGVIDVESEPGRGTTITIYFPSAPGSVSAPPAAVPRPTPHGMQRILLVDDEIIIRETLEELLVACGYTVHTASGGREALELFRDRYNEIDIVITDLGMPEMGGEELYAHLREINPDVKVIVSSGYLDGTTQTELLKIGVRDVLAKPVKILDLQAAIRSVLESA